MIESAYFAGLMFGIHYPNHDGGCSLKAAGKAFHLDDVAVNF
jgi:hypothetical protein